MSCCDDSTVKFKNESDTVWTVSLISTPNRFEGLQLGDSFKNGEDLSGSVFSTDGWDGEIWGGIQFTNSDGVELNLEYYFKPSSRFGTCPCYAYLIFPDSESGQYVANGEFTNGENDGEAHITWKIKNLT